MLAPNAMHVMEEMLDIGDRLRRLGDTFDAIHLYAKTASSLDRLGGFVVEDEGVRGLSIARPVLHRELLRRCEELPEMIEIKYNAELNNIEEDEGGCSAVLKNGETIKGAWDGHRVSHD